MKRRTMACLAATALALTFAGDTAAQDTAEQRGPRVTAEPERIMALRERLELTEDQLTALEQLRAEGVEQRAERRATIDDMRSRLRAGEIERDEMRSFMEELRAAQPNAGDRRARIEGILTEDQLGSLQELRSRRSAMRGRRGEMRGARGQVRGGRAGVRGARRGARGARGAWRSEVVRRRAAARAWRR